MRSHISYEIVEMGRNLIISDFIFQIKKLKGVHQFKILENDDINEILELEKREENIIKLGLGRQDNKGVKEVLKRDIIIAFVTDMNFEWPPGPNIMIELGGEIIGEDTSDLIKIEKLKNDEKYIVKGTFILNKEKMLELSKNIKNETPVIIFPLKKLPGLENSLYIYDVNIGSPCPTSFAYIMKRIGITQIGNELGVALIGFNTCI